MNIDKEREAFERWAEGKEYLIGKYNDGEYMADSTELRWEGWQSRAALLPSESELYELLAKTSMQFEKEPATLGEYFTGLAQAIHKLLEEPHE